MAETKIPYDQRLARACIRPFAGTALHPNVVTGISLALGIASGLSFAAGGPGMQHIAALMFMLAVFVDHMDGELARMTGKVSRAGYYLDYLVGSLNYTILFSAIGLGIYQWNGSEIALWIGLAAGLSNPIIVALRLMMERRFWFRSRRTSERWRLRTRGFYLFDRTRYMARRPGVFLLALRYGNTRISALDRVDVPSQKFECLIAGLGLRA